MHCHPFLLAAPKSLYLHGSYAPSKISTFRTPSSSALPKGSDRHPGAPHAGFPSSFWISGLLGWPRPTEQEPLLLAPAPARCWSEAQWQLSLPAPQVWEAEVWREGGPAQVPSNPSGVPTPPVPSRVAELTLQTGGPAPPASPTFRRPLGSAHAGRLRSSASKGRFVRALLAPRHRAAHAAEPGTRPSKGRD